MARITLEGIIATTPRLVVTRDGLAVVSFRFAEKDTSKESSESLTNWFTVVAYNELANQITCEFEKNNRVVLSGGLKVRDWNNGERSGVSVEVKIDTIASIPV